MSKHTPGPWIVVEYAGDVTMIEHHKPTGYGHAQSQIARILPLSDEKEGNAHLIAAAPAMLEALAWAVGMAEEAIAAREAGDDPEDTPDVIAMHRESLAEAKAALRAARGEG